MSVERLKGHGWKPGTSGNPGGRPLGLERRVRALIGDDMDAMTIALRDMVLDPTAPRRDRIEAYKVLADRGWGKARQTVDLTGDMTIGQRVGPALAPLTDEQLLLLAELDVEGEQDALEPAQD